MLIQELAAFGRRWQEATPPDEVLTAAARAVADWWGATTAGAGREPSRIVRETVADTPGPCLLVGRNGTGSSRAAALVNATASHVVEMDDIFREGVYHPGSPTVGAALAAAQREHVSGERLLSAVAIGYEIGDRIAEAIQPSHYRFWHTTGTVGTLGAAAAVAVVLGLEEPEFAHAIATATTMAAGLQQAFRSDSMSKPLHAGNAAESGLTAAYLARGGFTGALDVLEGPAGFGAGMSESPRWQDVPGRLGDPWAVTTPTVKFHACCGHTFAAVDAALELRREGVDFESIRSIDIETYTVATQVAGYPRPRTPFEARFSLAYCVATAFRTGVVRLDAFEPVSVADPAVGALLDSVTVRADPALDALFPSRRVARVRVTLSDGSVRERVRHTRKGDPDDPLSDAELRDKFVDLASATYGERAPGFFDELLRIGELADIAELREPEES